MTVDKSLRIVTEQSLEDGPAADIMAVALADEASALGEAFRVLIGPAVYITSKGAVGDDATISTAQIRASVTAAEAFGLDLFVPDGNFVVDDEITLTRIKVHGPGVIRQVTAGKAVFIVAGDNVEINDVELRGRRYGLSTTVVASEDGIRVIGASASSPVKGYRQRNVKFKGFGQYGTWLKYADNFGIFTSNYDGIGNMAVGGESVSHGFVSYNRINDIPTLGSFLSYGVALSRSGRVTSLVTDPRSSDVLVQGNIISNVAWEALDTHGGERINFIGNITYKCGAGVVIGPATAADDPAHPGTPVYAYAPIDCHATGNILDSGVTDGSASHAISLVGATGGFGSGAGVAPIEYAPGCSATGNTIKGYGTESNGLHGAIYMHDTRGALVEGNTFVDCSPHGVMVYYNNVGYSISNNTFVDMWSNTINHVAAVCSREAGNDGWISGNVLRSSGARAGAIYNNMHGIAALVSTTIKTGGNDWTGATDVPIYTLNAAWVAFSIDLVITSTVGFRAPNGVVGTPAYSFTGDTDTGFYWLASGDFGVASNGALTVRFQPSTVSFTDGVNLSFGTTNGTKIGQSITHKLAFYGATPIVRPAALTATVAAAPAGGTGTAAGGWDTAANRDAAIAAINNHKTRIDELESRLRSLGLLT